VLQKKYSSLVEIGMLTRVEALIEGWAVQWQPLIAAHLLPSFFLVHARIRGSKTTQTIPAASKPKSQSDSTHHNQHRRYFHCSKWCMWGHCRCTENFHWSTAVIDTTCNFCPLRSLLGHYSWKPKNGEDRHCVKTSRTASQSAHLV